MSRPFLTAALVIAVAFGPGRFAHAQTPSVQSQTPGGVSAQPSESSADNGWPVTWSASTTVVSKFIWRGFVVSDEPSVQPAALLSIGPLAISSWVNLVTRGSDHGWSEHDLTVDYTRPAGRWELSVGYTNYYFPTADSARVSHEFYGGVAWTGPLNPFARVFHDIKAGHGTYVSLGIGQTIPIGDSEFSVTPEITLGYNNHQWVTGSGWSDLNAGLTLEVALGAHADLGGSFNYSKSLRTAWFPSRFASSLSLTVH